MLERLSTLAQVFAIDTCAFAILSNYYHLVVRVDRDRAQSWTDEEVVARWGNGHEHKITMQYVRNDLAQALGIPIELIRADFSAEIARKRQYVQEQWPREGIPDETIQRVLKVLHPTGIPFLDLCLWKGRFPSRRAQFCTQFLKRLPLDNYLLDLLRPGVTVESWRGTRRDESAAREEIPGREQTAEGYWIVNRIADWTSDQVIAFARRRGLPLNPLYRQGQARVGCMPCINCRKDDLLEIHHRWPEYIDVIREWEELVSLASKRGWTTFFADSALTSSTPKEGWRYDPILREDGSVVHQWTEPDPEVYERLRVDSRVRWAQTARGGREIDLLRTLPKR